MENLWTQELYSTYNEGKLVVVERLLEEQYCLTDIVGNYNITFHKTIKIKPIDIKPGSYAVYKVDSNEKILNLKLVIM